MASTGATPKNTQARQSQEIVRTVLANKTVDEQCALMDAMSERKVYQETDVALEYGGYNLLSITDYITVVQYEIDQFMINKFWQCLSENLATDISREILHWLGYDNINEGDLKYHFNVNVISTYSKKEEVDGQIHVRSNFRKRDYIKKIKDYHRR